MRYLSMIAAGAAMMLVALSGAQAADIEVEMLNRGEKGAMVFEADLVRIEPGESIRFVPVDKGHNAESIDGMLPDGAEPFAGKMNENLTVTFDVPGVYGIKCKPHYGMGMVALVVVGAPENVEEAKAIRHPGKAKQVFSTLFDELDAVRSTEQ